MVAILEEVLYKEEEDIEVEEGEEVGHQIGEYIVNYVENPGTLLINATIGLTEIFKGILAVRIFRILSIFRVLKIFRGFPRLILGQM